MSCLSRDKTRVSILTEDDMYHEKQHKELCAMHALNNLFQGQLFTKQQLNDICINLSPDYWINPHKSMLGTGNYDVNVIMSALQSQNCETIWFDKRKSIDHLALENILGFILNIPTDYKWGIVRLPIHRKHWISIRKINNVYYNLDSKKDAPEKIGSPQDLKMYLKEEMQCKDKEMLIVVTKETCEKGSWKSTPCCQGSGNNNLKIVNGCKSIVDPGNTSDKCDNNLLHTFYRNVDNNSEVTVKSLPVDGEENTTVCFSQQSGNDCPLTSLQEDTGSVQTQRTSGQSDISGSTTKQATLTNVV